MLYDARSIEHKSFKSKLPLVNIARRVELKIFNREGKERKGKIKLVKMK
jgi:hypothetical protein